MVGVILVFLCVGAFLRGTSCHPEANRHTKAGDVGIDGLYRQIVIQDAPFMSSLRFDGIHWCGASIIHKRFVLTAAHCIEKNRKNDYEVLVGTNDFTRGGELYEIENFFIHEEYNHQNYDFNFCLIKLKSEMGFDETVNKIHLADDDFMLNVHQRDDLNFTGWCSAKPRIVESPKLIQVKTNKVGKQNCTEKYNKYDSKIKITGNMFCAEHRGWDSCQGDSGSPLTLGNTLIGVASFHGRGKVAAPSVYARVASVNKWIMEKIDKVRKNIFKK